MTTVQDALRRDRAPHRTYPLALRALQAGRTRGSHVLAAVMALDLSGEWWSTPTAVVHTRPVTYPYRRGAIAAVAATAALVGIAVSGSTGNPLIVGGAILAGVPLAITGTYTAVESFRASRFAHPIDTYVTNLVRTDPTAKGQGIERFAAVNHHETTAGRTIGSTAANRTVRDRVHLPAGLVLDDEHDPDCLRTISPPVPPR